jgi:hypothetical protein
VIQFAKQGDALFIAAVWRLTVRALKPHLEKCRTPRWHAVITWLLLTGLAEIGLVPVFGLVRVAESCLSSFATPVASWVPTLHPLWEAGSMAFVLHWFEPFLLRLDRRRGCAWLALRAVTYLIMDLLLSSSAEDWRWQLGGFVLAAGPSFALIGCRTRPWVIIPAAMLLNLACCDLSILDLRFEYLYPAAVAIYAGTLLYGTEPRTSLVPDAPPRADQPAVKPAILRER